MKIVYYVNEVDFSTYQVILSFTDVNGTEESEICVCSSFEGELGSAEERASLICDVLNKSILNRYESALIKNTI